MKFNFSKIFNSTVVVCLLLGFGWFLSQLSPVLHDYSQEDYVLTVDEVDRAYQSFRYEYHSNSSEKKVQTIKLTTLVSVVVRMYYQESSISSSSSDEIHYKVEYVDTFIKWDYVVVFVFIYLTLLSSLLLYNYNARKSKSKLNDLSEENNSSLELHIPNQESNVDFDRSYTFENHIDDDINDLQFDTDKANSRSMLLLISGLSTAIFGIVIFYVNFPNEISSGADLNILIFSAFRSVGILIFIESIAWFLLKQYRNSMYDYKYFYSLLLKRKNYRLCYNINSLEHDKNYDDLVLDLLGPKEVDDSLELRKIDEKDGAFKSSATNFLKFR